MTKRRGSTSYLRRNPRLAVGLFLLLSLILFSGIGRLFVDTSNAKVLSAPTVVPPSKEYPLGTTFLGRDLLAVMIVATDLTLRIGFIAGILGVTIAAVLGFIAAYYGGVIDGFIRWVVEVGLTIPSLLILILIATSLGGISVNQMALVVASTAWIGPTRSIRSQVLSFRERPYVDVARLSGMSGLEIIFIELMPNLLPYLMANLVAAVSLAILASIGMEALGLGPVDPPTLGSTIYNVIESAALSQGWWWWILWPTLVLLILFLGLFLISAGLDEIANPRLRKTV